MKWINGTRDRHQWLALVNMEVNFGFHQSGEFHGQLRDFLKKISAS
jgi:hypothetical protein